MTPQHILVFKYPSRDIGLKDYKLWMLLDLSKKNIHYRKSISAIKRIWQKPKQLQVSLFSFTAAYINCTVLLFRCTNCTVLLLFRCTVYISCTVLILSCTVIRHRSTWNVHIKLTNKACMYWFDKITFPKGVHFFNNPPPFRQVIDDFFWGGSQIWKIGL